MKPKAIGTAWEMDVVRLAETHGLAAWRLSEQGSNDQGDVMLRLPDGSHVVVEAKCRSNLTVHPEVEKANSKARHPSGTFQPTFAVLAWKRLVATDGERRRQAGKPVMVLDLEDGLRLLARPAGKVKLRG